MPRGVITTIEVPDPPALTPTETGATTQGPAYRLDVPAVSTEPLVVTTPDGWTLSWRPTDLWYVDESGILDPIIGSTPSSVEISGRLARYKRSFPASDDVFLAEASRVKHYVVLQERPRDPAPYLTGRTYFCVSGMVACYRKGHKVPLPEGEQDDIKVGPFLLPKPVASDLAADHCKGFFKVVNTDEGQQLFAMIPADWLLDPDRLMPVSVDPTIGIGQTAFYAGGSGVGKHVHMLSDGITTVAILQLDEGEEYAIGIFKSINRGQTWTRIGTITLDSDYDTNMCAVSSYVDEDDNIHIVVSADESDDYYKMDYIHVRLNSDRTGINYNTLNLIDKSATYADSCYGSVIAERDPSGSGWKAHVFFVETNDGSSQSYYLRYITVTISSTYTLTKGSTTSVDSVTGVDEANWPGAFVMWLGPNRIGVWWLGDQLYFMEASRSSPTGSWSFGARRIIVSSAYLPAFISQPVIYGDYLLIGVSVSDSGTRKARIYRAALSNTASWTSIYEEAYQSSGMTMIAGSDGNVYYFSTIRRTSGIKAMVYDGTTFSVQTILEAEGEAGDVTTGLITNGVVLLYTTDETKEIRTYVILLNAPPLEPTVAVPPAFDSATGLTVTVTMNDEDQSDTLSGVYLKIGSRWWNGSTLVDAEPGAPIPASGTVAQITLPGGLWQVGQTYQITAATVDAAGAKGPYNSVPVVTKASVKPTVAILEPIHGAAITTTRIPVRATMTVASGVAPASYRVAIYADTGEQLFGQVFESSSALDAAIDVQLPNGIAIQLGITPVDSDGLPGDEQRVSLTVSYVAPQPVFGLMAIPDATQAAIRLRWRPGDQPDVFSGQYEVYRDGKRIARVTQPESGDPIYIDRAVASGVIYTYAVLALGTNGTAGPLSEVQAVVDFEGWRFTPVDNPSDEVRFAFDWRARRQRDEDRHEVQTRGRYPVVFRGPSKPFRLTITAAYDGEGDLTVQEWADRIYALSGRLGYLRAPDGGIWYGELHTPSDDWDRQLAVMARVVTVQFVELGPVPIEV